MNHSSAKMSYPTQKTIGTVGARPAGFDIVAPSLLAALISGLINIVYTVSFGALIFKGTLADAYPLGISTILFSYAIAGFVMAGGSSLPGLIVTPKGVLTAIISIMGGLVMYIGADLLLESVFKSRRRLPKTEFALVALIIVSIAVLGFLPGIGVGILVAVFLFVVNCGRMDVVKSHLSGKIYHSKVERSKTELDVLEQYGNRLQIFILQGHLFFGTAERLLDRIRSCLHDGDRESRGRVRFILLDFRNVHDIDSSALNAFTKLKAAAPGRVVLAFSDMHDSIEAQFAAAGYFDGKAAHRFDHLDYALEWCEERLIRSVMPEFPHPPGIDAQLLDILHDSAMAAEFKPLLERIALKAGEVLFRMGDRSDGLYVIASGRVATVLPKADGNRLRLRTMGPGTLLGEIGLYTERPRSTDAVAETGAVLYALGFERFREMERQHPDMARQLHRHVVLSISRRMALDSEAMRVMVS